MATTKPTKKKFHPNDLLSGLFDEQKAFVIDPSTFKSGCCGRRAGKSWSCAIALLHAAMTSNDCICVYLGLTRRSAKNIMWRLLKQVAQKYNLRIDFKESDLVAHLPNGSEIWLFGANDEATAENLRGNPYKLAVFDECASWRGHLENVIDEIVLPAILDNNGQIALIGTPSTDFQSLFYKANHTLAEYSRHHWSVLNNPHLQGQKFIDDIKRLKKWTDDNPILLREYFGMWVRSTSDLIYRYNPMINSLDTLPTFPLIKIMGIDIGFNDSDAIEVLGYNPDYSSKVYRIDGIKKSKQNIDQLAKLIVTMRDKHKPSEIVMDEGGLGKKIGEELRVRYSLPIQPTDKIQKLANIEFLNADLEAGNILVPETSCLAEEWLNLPWSDDSRKKEDPSADNHSSDAFLYAYRKCRPYLYREPDPQPTVNSAEYWKLKEREMLESCQEQLNGSDDDWSRSDLNSLFDDI